MGFFYDRTETENKIVIRMKNVILYYIAYFGLVLAFFAAFALSGLISPLVGCIGIPTVTALLLVLWLNIRKMNSEVRNAMKKGKVVVSGSRLSGFTYEISK